MLNKGVPFQMVRWIRVFLDNRRARVKVNNTLGRSFAMLQGLPQGAVLSALLFLLFVDDLASILPEHTDPSLFADDAALSSSHKEKKVATENIQEAIKAVEEWSNTKKLKLNIDKCEVTFFSTNTHEVSKFVPKITIRGNEVKYNKSPTFLGVKLDNSLSFVPDVNMVTEKLEKRKRVLASLTSKTWGFQKQHLRTVHLALQATVLNYAAPAWQPFLSPSELDRIQKAQNKSLRIITGQYNSTPVEAQRAEANIPSYKTTSQRLTVISYEKALRLPLNHPRHITALNETNHRLCRSSWRREATGLVRPTPLDNVEREPLPSPFFKPWLDEPCTNLEYDTAKETTVETMQPNLASSALTSPSTLMDPARMG